MRISKYLFAAIVSFTTFASISFVLAQGQASTITPQNQESKTEATLLADVGLVDITSVEKEGTYSGRYFLQGKSGQQNNIVTGIIVYNAKGEIVDIKPLEKGLSIREGELKPFFFSYSLPSNLSGKIKFIIKAQSDGGLPLGVNIIGEKVLKNVVIESMLSCFTKDSVFSCQPKENGDIAFSITPKSIVAPVSVTEVVTGTIGKPATFSTPLTPGKYFISATYVKTGEKKFGQITVAGIYGSIINTSVSSQEAGVLQIVTVAKISAIDTATVTINLLSLDGKVCGTSTGEISSRTPVASMKIQSTCKEGTVSIKLNSKETLLDSKTETFSTIKYVVQKVEPKNDIPNNNQSNRFLTSFSTWMWIVSAGLLFALGYIYFLIRKSTLKPSDEGEKQS